MNKDVICICGGIMKLMKASRCYSRGRPNCNKCSHKPRNNKSSLIYHCIKEKDSKLHSNGFDICIKCSKVPIEKSNYIKIKRAIRDYKPPYSDQLLDCYVIPNLISKFQTAVFTLPSFNNLYEYVTIIGSNVVLFNDCGENDCDLFQEDMKTMKAYTSAPKHKNLYTGKTQTIDTFPFVLAEMKGINKNRFINCIIDKKAQKHLQTTMNKYQKTNTDIINDCRIANFINRGNNATINDIIDPNKNLGSLFVDVPKEKWNYPNLIPTVLMVNDDNQCKYLSQIPNVNPYSRNGRAVYGQLSHLFGNMIEMFEHVCRQRLRNIPLQVIIKAQDYDIQGLDGWYEGNRHKEGIFENIVCVGLYYYEIDDNIEGGELELSGLFEKSSKGYNGASTGSVIVKKQIAVEEGMGIVFSNKLYHKVCRIGKTKSKMNNDECHRKLIAFFLVDPNVKVDTRGHTPDARSIIVNSKYNGIELLKKWVGLNHDNENEMSMVWLYKIIGEYLEGDKEYIEFLRNKFRYCRKAWATKHHSYNESSLESNYESSDDSTDESWGGGWWDDEYGIENDD